MSWQAVKLILTLKCEQSTRLMSEALDRELPFAERWAVRLHALCCGACRRYRRQLRFLRLALRRRLDDLAQTGPPALSPEARDRLRGALARQSGENSP